MRNKVLHLTLFPFLLAGCGFPTDFGEFNNELGITMPSKYVKLLSKSETTIDSSVHYNVYSVEEEWKLEYQTQFQTDSGEPFDLDRYIDVINGYEPLDIPEEYRIPHSTSLDWACKRAIRQEGHSSRHYEWLLIYDSDTKMLYTLDGNNQIHSQVIPFRD